MPLLADEGIFLASESTMYRILREAKLQTRRGPARAPAKKTAPPSHCAEAPNRVWSWDITYLRSNVRGCFFYLYMCVDVFSRKIVGWSVEDREEAILAEPMLCTAFKHEHVQPQTLVLHSDNGAPMKASTLLATLRSLGIAQSFSRPHVSDDNPFSEALFRTLKYRPEYPQTPFDSVDEARAWVEQFVDWYNHEHLHSALRFVSPAARHARRDPAILAARQRVYQAAHLRTPSRWSRSTRNWTPRGPVYLNPGLSLSKQLDVVS